MNTANNEVSNESKANPSGARTWPVWCNQVHLEYNYTVMISLTKISIRNPL
ncbi:hypothetical protein [Klebsiella phage Kpn13]|uniref:Uncharacterized protein n=1 Tax=Klebsiella phage Kpn13 TaxID=3044024 RepID=A0AAT9V6A1_9CAUD|nr:hypothetical protein [Klebsiella phage Kpn13]